MKNFINNILIPINISRFLLSVLTIISVLAIARRNKILLLLGIAIAIINIIVNVIINKNKNIYGKMGSLAHWYDTNLKIIGTNWICSIYDKLIDNHIVNKSKIIFVDPSANRGTYNKALFEYLTSRDCNCKFIISDKEDIKNHEASYTNENGIFSYIPKRDASDIGNTIKSCGIDKVNIVWDFKGCIWHYMRDKDKHTNKYDKLKLIFAKYNEVLSDEGIIVIDAIDSSTAKPTLSILSYFFIFKPINFMERSSYFYLTELLKDNKIENIKAAGELKDFLNKFFEPVQFISTEINNPNFDNIKVAVFKKRKCKEVY